MTDERDATLFGAVDHAENGPDDGAPDTAVAAAEIREWWMGVAAAEVDGVVPKMVEYGGLGRAVDLIDIGRDILRGQRVPEGYITDELATEFGIYFYVRGKLSRWTAAVIRGERVSDDTLHDISVYVKMAQRNRDVGGWPL